MFFFPVFSRAIRAAHMAASVPDPSIRNFGKIIAGGYPGAGGVGGHADCMAHLGAGLDSSGKKVPQAMCGQPGPGQGDNALGHIGRAHVLHFLLPHAGLPEDLRDWQGNVKPSSEKGIHADAYRLRPEAGFVIHTHQYWASIAAGRRLPAGG